MPTRALILVFHAIIVSGGAASQCPAISDWRNTPISAGGPLVCAKIYEDRNCSRRPLQVGLNESLPDLQRPFSIMVKKAEKFRKVSCPLAIRKLPTDGTHSTRMHSSSLVWPQLYGRVRRSSLSFFLARAGNFIRGTDF